jgi:PHP family Zn ribbon phosphoesterase
MQNGDISNEIKPRILVEFEDLLGNPVEEKRRIFRTNRKKTPHIDNWALNDQVARVINHMVYHLRQNVEVITSHDYEFADELKRRLDQRRVWAQDAWSYKPEALARELAFMPYVAALYTANPQHMMLYGPSKARLVTPENFQQMGQF